jgi:hypothetical protein
MKDSKIKLVYGVGFNDSGYVTQISEVIGRHPNGRRIWKLVWQCPFYRKWTAMLSRCYNENYSAKRISYEGCSVVEEWHLFSNFKAWMEQQDWEGKQLDKDILCVGNKVYGPETCVFVDRKVNVFIIDRAAARGEWPIGVYFNNGAFQSRCKSVTTNTFEYLGRFKTPEEAHAVWLAFKLEQARILAAEQTDERVAKALIDRYENYQKTG